MLACVQALLTSSTNAILGVWQGRVDTELRGVFTLRSCIFTNHYEHCSYMCIVPNAPPCQQCAAHAVHAVVDLVPSPITHAELDLSKRKPGLQRLPDTQRPAHAGMHDHQIVHCSLLLVAARRRTTSDAPCVTNMRALGAVLLGKAAMPELDSIVTSGNASCNSTLNPHNADKLAGGGSAGCCAAVAAGLCPLAIGTDAGGATVVPGSFCGVVGLKPSKGRLADDHGESLSAVNVSTVQFNLGTEPASGSPANRY